MRYAFIKDKQGEFPLFHLCRVLHVSRSGYYEWNSEGRRAVKQEEYEFVRTIEKIFLGSRQTYGSPHSDRGVQYASHEYRSLAEEHGLLQSMSRKGNCWNNAPMESFFDTLKTELVHHESYETLRDAWRSIFEWIEVFYNRIRIHSS